MHSAHTVATRGAVFGVLLASAVGCRAPGGWRRYEVYEPRIERHFVVNTHAQQLKYNHDSSVAWFRDRWFCLWNANEPPAEGRPGQLNYVSTSRDDGATWSPAEPVFSSERHSANPIPCPKGTQWQPNLIVVRGRLWAVWSQHSRDGHAGCYVSTLSDPDGKWTNRLLKWDGDTRPLIDGKRFRVFPTQNPLRLRSGRVLAPVTLIGPKAPDAPPMVKRWWATEKRDSVLYTDDLGKIWHVSPGAVQPGRTWAQWEPTVWELADGTVMMFSRNNDFRGRPDDGPRPSQMLQWSLSADGGATWTPHRPVPLQTIASRMHVLPCGGDRFVMVHNDWPAGQFVSDRHNLALFFTRGAGIDFVAGPGISGAEPIVAYPQMWTRRNAMLVSYSQGRAYRSIKVARVAPLPHPRRHYLFPRSNVRPSGAPAREADALRFNGSQHAATRAVVDVGDAGFAVGAWVWPEQVGVLLDTRTTNPPSGFVWGLMGHTRKCLPFVWVDSPERNLVVSPALKLRPAAWNYVGLSLDNRAGTATFHVNGRSETLKFTAPAPRPLRGTTGHVGAKRFAGSGLPAFVGKVRAMALYADPRLGAQEHAWLHNAFAKALGQDPRRPARRPVAKPVLFLDPADAAATARDFAIPERRVPVGRVTLDGVDALRFTGEGSAGVDLDENHRERGDRVEIAFRFRIERGETHVLCTLGDADHPARLVHGKGRLWLEAGDEKRPCGQVRKGGWTSVVLTSGGVGSTASVEAGEPVTVKHKPVATWAYLGQGYRTGTVSSDAQFVVDVVSVRSRVIRSRQNIRQ